MPTPFDFPRHASDRLLAAASALVISGVLMALALVPASPAMNITMGALA